MTGEYWYLFYILLFIVAFLYASVGHGGASGYLALMAIFSVTPAVMRPTALLLNLFVSLTSFIQFYRGGHFKWKIFLPFALASVPFSFVGGMINIDSGIYNGLHRQHALHWYVWSYCFVITCCIKYLFIKICFNVAL